MAQLLGGRYLLAGLIGLTGLAPACWWASRSVAAHPRISTRLTWHTDIQPLMARHCASCHDAGAPVPLTTWREARPWVGAIREEVLERRMPPQQGVPGVDQGIDDYALSPMERDLIVAWIDGGAPEGRPDMPRIASFWCRMHPEIRAERAGACPLCGMPLSAFTPDLTRRYGWSWRPMASAAPGQERRVTLASLRPSGPELTPHAAPPPAVASKFTIEERTAGARTRPELESVHEHPLHLFIVSEDFRSFDHVHPALDTAGDGTWSFIWRPPASGRYWFYGDFLPSGGAPQMLQRMIAVGPRAPMRGRHPASASMSAAAPASAAARALQQPDVRVASGSGLRGTLTIPSLRAGDVHRLTIALDDEGTQAPITDLQPYLGAWGHLFVLYEGHEALHAHPDATGTMAGGPAIAFDVLFPRAGVYYIWSQFQRRGAIVTLPFRVRVAPRA